jgi:hypothetical protein
MKRKWVIIVLIVLIVLIGVIIVLSLNSNKENENVNELNNNSNVIKNQTLENLSIEKVSIATTKDNKSTFSAEISNTSDTPNTFELIKIIIKDKDGNIMTTLEAYVGILNKGDITKISVDSGMDISNAYTVEYEVGE